MNRIKLAELKLIIEKIDYLYKCLQDTPDSKTVNLQIILLKQYSTELYDKILEIEKSTLEKREKSSAEAPSIPVVEDEKVVQMIENDTTEVKLSLEGSIDEEKELKEEIIDEAASTTEIPKDSETTENMIDSSDFESPAAKFESFIENDEMEEWELPETENKTEDVLESLVNEVDGETPVEDMNAATVLNGTEERSTPMEELRKRIEERNSFKKQLEEATTDYGKTEVLNIGNSDTSEVNIDVVNETIGGEENNDLNSSISKEERPSLADQLASKVINEGNDFNIGFNQRYTFINELFGGNENVYEGTLTELSKCSNVIEAFTYLNLHVKMKYKWQDDNPATREFLDIVKARFLG